MNTNETAAIRNTKLQVENLELHAHKASGIAFTPEQKAQYLQERVVDSQISDQALMANIIAATDPETAFRFKLLYPNIFPEVLEADGATLKTNR